MVGLRCKEIICELIALAAALEAHPWAQRFALTLLDGMRWLVRRLGAVQAGEAVVPGEDEFPFSDD